MAGCLWSVATLLASLVNATCSSTGSSKPTPWLEFARGARVAQRALSFLSALLGHLARTIRPIEIGILTIAIALVVASRVMLATALAPRLLRVVANSTVETLALLEVMVLLALLHELEAFSVLHGRSILSTSANSQ